jgi:hypothetical protein
MDQGLPGQKVSETPSQQIAGYWGLHPKLHKRLRLGVSQFQTSWGQKVHEIPSQWKKAGCGGTDL